MTTLREAAQQALEALEQSETFVSYEGFGMARREAERKHQAAIAALRAALAEPVLQTCNCRWDGEVQVQQCTLHETHVDAIHEWAERAKTAEKKLAALAEQRLTDMEQKMERSIESLKAALVEDAMQKFTDVNQELEAALAEPVQEPVAWRFEARHIDSAWAAAVTLKHPGPEGVYMRNVTPLYAAPPQRKPLTEEEIQAAWDSVDMRHPRGNETRIAFARAIERAHGITP